MSFELVNYSLIQKLKLNKLKLNKITNPKSQLLWQKIYHLT
jgi:hypothetical protein